MPTIHLTFDTEEWTIPQLYKVRSRHNEKTCYSMQGLERLLPLLKKLGAKSTFFVTGYFAEKEPEIVKKIAKEGHEIGSHAYTDIEQTSLPEKRIEKGLKKTKKILEKISRSNIIGFRAPRCFINSHILNVLEKLNFKYDSSIHPAIVFGKYYNINRPLGPYHPDKNNILKKGDMKILEIPISVIPIIRFPISWWWMRNLGNWVTTLGTWINLKQKRNVILYFHPWEFTELPSVRGVPDSIVQNTGKPFLKKLKVFIDYFQKQGYEFNNIESELDNFLLRTDS